MIILKILFWPLELIFGLAMLILRVTGKLIGAFYRLTHRSGGSAALRHADRCDHRYPTDHLGGDPYRACDF